MTLAFPVFLLFVFFLLPRHRGAVNHAQGQIRNESTVDFNYPDKIWPPGKQFWPGDPDYTEQQVPPQEAPGGWTKCYWACLLLPIIHTFPHSSRCSMLRHEGHLLSFLIPGFLSLTSIHQYSGCLLQTQIPGPTPELLSQGLLGCVRNQSLSNSLHPGLQSIPLPLCILE